MKYYVILVWSDIEPETYGPFATDEERDAKALELRAEDDEESGIYPATVDDSGLLDVGTYSGAFFDEVDNACEFCGATEGEVHPSSCATFIERQVDEEVRA